MSKKIWKANIIISIVMFVVLLVVGTSMLVIASQGTPWNGWFREDGTKYTVVAFELSSTYVIGGLILAISFLFLGFLVINYFIRKSIIKDIKREKETGEVKMDLNKYGFLLAHVLPFTKKEKEILEGVRF